MKLFKEPLLHFLIAGGLLFAAYGWLNGGARGPGAGGPRQVRIGDGEVQWLTETWARQWMRGPTREELRGLVTELLKEELLSREARELKLDENDTIVRRRLAQKMAFLVADVSQLSDPTEDDLRRFYQSHPEGFREPARVSFTQIYFSRERRARAADDAKAARARLSRGGKQGDPAELGDPLLIESEFEHADEQTVSGQFGSEFARALFALAPGAWHGPIESGYGLHLVRVSEARPARLREFAEVRARVLDEWRDAKQREASRQYFAGLLEKYEIVVDPDVKTLIGPIDSSLAGPLAGSPGAPAPPGGGSSEAR